MLPENLEQMKNATPRGIESLPHWLVTCKHDRCLRFVETLRKKLGGQEIVIPTVPLVLTHEDAKTPCAE